MVMSADDERNAVKFECDQDLPYESLEIENKIFLLQLLDIEGGPQANNRKTRLLAKFTAAYPSRFGVRHSERYYRTKWLLDRWKRDKNFPETKKALLASALSPSCEPSCIRPYSQPSSLFNIQDQKPAAKTKPQPKGKKEAPAPTKKSPPAPPATTSTAVQSPPPLKKKASVTMTTFGSPLRMIKGSGTKKGKPSLLRLLY